MRKSKIKLSVPNAIIFVNDESIEELHVPEIEPGSIIGYTSNCVSIGTQTEYDGEVDIVFGKKNANIPGIPSLNRIFHGAINTPGGCLAVVTCHNEIILRKNTGSKISFLSVYVNDIRFPSKILLLTGV